MELRYTAKNKDRYDGYENSYLLLNTNKNHWIKCSRSYTYTSIRQPNSLGLDFWEEQKTALTYWKKPQQNWSVPLSQEQKYVGLMHACQNYQLLIHQLESLQLMLEEFYFDDSMY